MLIEIDICTDFSSLNIPCDEWDSLTQSNETNTIFQTYNWNTSWIETFGKDQKLFILLAKVNGNICGVAPLIILNTDANYKTLSFIGAGNSDYLDFLVPKNKYLILKYFFEVIKKHNSEWDVIYLNNIPNFSTTTGILHSLIRTHSSFCKFDTQTICPTLRIKDRTEEANRIANKYSTSRPLKNIKKHGEVEHRIFTDQAAATKHFDTFISQHIEQWHNTNTTSQFLNEDAVGFYKKIIDSLLPKGQLFFSAIFLNGTPISFHFGFDYNSVITWYKPSYSLTHAKHSPGIVLIKSIIDYSISNNKSEFDFTIGNEPFKMRFSNLNRRNNNIRIMKKGLRAYIRKLIVFTKACISFNPK